MRRAAFVVFALLCVAGAFAQQEVFDLRQAVGTSFDEIALLPTRLTSFNQHDDAARATYTCCKPWQEREIELALRANAAFLLTHPTSDFADDTLMHNARVTSVKKDFRAEIAAYQQLVTYYPDSDLADDACWGLANMYMRDQDHIAAIDTLNTLIFTWPESTWADDAHLAIAREFRAVDDEAGYLQALEGLVRLHPRSDHCACALAMLADKYREVENYEAAIRASEDLIARFPCSDRLDDAMFCIAESLRHSGSPHEALAMYRRLIEELPGSALTNRAMREANTLARNLRGRGAMAPAPYNVEAVDAGEAARDMFDYACHLQNYRQFAEAIQAYRQFARTFPGSDNFDDALYNIGVCYQQMNILFEDINEAEGPEDLFRLQSRFEDAVGRRQAIPSEQHLSAVRDAAGAFAEVVNHLEGSDLRDDALYEIAKTYEDSERTEDMVYTYQQLVIFFPGSEYEMEALYEVLKYYADPANYDFAVQMYPALSAAYPNLFPEGLAAAKTDFLTLMRAYSSHVSFGWFEYHHHHIPYRVTCADLGPDAAFTLAAINMARGQYKLARKQLEPLTALRTNDFCAPATYLLAQANERLNSLDTARDLYATVAQQFPDSGLADDAQLAVTRLGQEAPAEYVQVVRDSFPYAPGQVDYYVGDEIVVFAPYTVTVKMRQYNMPNIWEQSQVLLEQWTGAEAEGKVVICIDNGCRQMERAAVLLPGCKIADPPQWSLGFESLARRVIAQVAGNALGGEGAYIDGLAKFAAASLQYDLVTETRDAIGSASAVVLPQQDVLDARDRALAALEEYVREGRPGTPSPEVVAGMLYALLDSQGFSQERLIDRRPYARMFATLCEQAPEQPADEGTSAGLFAYALNCTFDGACGQQLRRWGFPIRGRMGG